MLSDVDYVEIEDINVGHINCYMLGNEQGITFSVGKDNIYKIVKQIGIDNIVCSLNESSEVLDLIHPSNIMDYLVSNYSKDELRKELEHYIAETENHVSKEHMATLTFKDYNETNHPSF